jgi:hypothetical protein
MHELACFFSFPLRLCAYLLPVRFERKADMNTFTSMLWLMFLKGIGVGTVTAFMSAVVYQVLFKDQYPNAGMTLSGPRDSADIWCRAAFGALPNPLNGVAVAEVVTATVIERQAHYIPYFASCSWRARFKDFSHDSTSTARIGLSD